MIVRLEINLRETIVSSFPKVLIKDLQKNERICPVCNGLGMRITDNVYGKHGDTSDVAKREHFPYKRQALSFCPGCYNGVQKLCSYCGEPFKERGYHHCDCVGFKKSEVNKRIEKWNEKIAKAKEVQEADVKTMLYCEEFDRYYDSTDDFFEYWADECEGEDIEKPHRLWVCPESEICFNASSLIEDACEELHENAIDNCDQKSLQEVLDNWCKEQTGTTTYYPCYEEYVLIDWNHY